MRDDLAIVVTADFFAPIVDDAFAYGEIAANNALSDVFAMGAEPLLCLNLVGWPRDDLPLDLLGEVLAGGQAVATEAGALIVGGHSVDDREPKYGMAVVGTVHPDDLRTNGGARIGDAVLLTKPIGTGLIVTGLKRDVADPAWVAAATATMRRSNGPAMRATRGVSTALTDVTGFGLLGHLRELAQASEVTISIDAASVPVLAGARGLAEAGVVSGGSRRNLEAAQEWTRWGDVEVANRVVLTDAQTAGGLLITVPEDDVANSLAALRAAGDVDAVRIGSVEPAEPGVRIAVH